MPAHVELDGPLETDRDPDLTRQVEEWDRMAIPSWPAMSLEAARRLEDELFSPTDPPPVGGVRDFAIDGPGGELPLRIYRPPEAGPAPTLVHYHGGGWVLGTLDSADDICRRLCRETAAVVISVDYRLAPEHPFPEPVDDAYAALEWAVEHAGAVGGDPDRVAVSGTSAGGNLAAATALRAQSFDGPDLAGQVLLYPVLAPDFGTDSYRAHADDPLLSREEMIWFWEQYCRSPVDRANPYAAPLRAETLSGLPATVVVTAGHDPLRDEGIAYADRLAGAGVPVTLEHYPGMAHGFLSLASDVPAAAVAFEDVGGLVSGFW